jgi:hypothetical protein
MITSRQSIADALSTVDGITGYPERPKVTKAGDAWALVNQLTRGPGAAFQTEWRIAVTIAADVATATDRFDTLIPEVTQALQEVAYVDSARPIAVPTEAGDLYGAEILARSE